ncbi:20121_t:CDS:2, partial [Funneliformis geosporum]
NSNNVQYNLAIFYQNGWGIEQNLEKAFYLYQKSADQNNSNSQYSLGELYYYGIGIKKDINKAFKWYEKSANQENNVLHRDLHSKNILIHERNAKITDFGISKIENNSTIVIGTFGKIAYMEPQILKNLKFQYIKPSDIYSLGVLMWEISSGHPPFIDSENVQDDIKDLSGIEGLS